MELDDISPNLSKSKMQTMEAERFETSSVTMPEVAVATLISEIPVSTSNDMKKIRQIELFSFGSLLWAMFMEGWNDGTNGPMLPRIESYYNVTSTSSYNTATNTYVY